MLDISQYFIKTKNKVIEKRHSGLTPLSFLFLDLCILLCIRVNTLKYDII
jgi:hypothetical protein